MKNYILIQNDGEIETNSFELIGASTKRNDSTKIGFFGSGLKYSIAYMMRNGIHFRIFSGEQELVFTSVPEELRGQIFNRICINGKETSYTTTMGPTWTEDWFVLREIYCNAVDESGVMLVKSISEVNSSVGKTRIYIECTEKLKNNIDNWDSYFSDERTPLFVSPPVYTSSIGDRNTQPVTIYTKTSGVLYRKGIRVSTEKMYLYDYELESVRINEDRTAMYATYISYGITNLMCIFVNEDYVKEVLNSFKNERQSFEYDSLENDSPQEIPSKKWIKFSQDNLLICTEVSGKYSFLIGNSLKPYYLIPKRFGSYLKKKHKDIQILGLSGNVGNISFEPYEQSEKNTFLLKEVLKSLEEMNYHVTQEISIVDFSVNGILGQADIKAKHIYISSSVFDMGRRKIAEVLIEENEHIISGKGDETREFQDHLISIFLGKMESSAALFL